MSKDCQVPSARDVKLLARGITGAWAFSKPLSGRVMSLTSRELTVTLLARMSRWNMFVHRHIPVAWDKSVHKSLGLLLEISTPAFSVSVQGRGQFPSNVTSTPPPIHVEPKG